MSVQSGCPGNRRGSHWLYWLLLWEQSNGENQDDSVPKHGQTWDLLALPRMKLQQCLSGHNLESVLCGPGRSWFIDRERLRKQEENKRGHRAERPPWSCFPSKANKRMLTDWHRVLLCARSEQKEILDWSWDLLGKLGCYLSNSDVWGAQRNKFRMGMTLGFLSGLLGPSIRS